jgi:outer membrane protein TolC
MLYNSTLIGQSYKNFGNSVGFNLSIPIYEKNKAKPQKKLALETNTAYKKQFERQFKQQQQNS